MFRLVEEPSSWPLAEWWPGAVGLGVGIFCTALVCPTPPLAALSWIGLCKLASRCTLFTFVTTALAVYWTCRSMTFRTRRDAMETATGMA